MARQSRRGPARGVGAAAAELSATLEELAARIGDRIGETVALRLRALAGEAKGRRVLAPKARCSREGCVRPVAAKALCKSHYNLMLYHRRRAQVTRGKAGAGKGQVGKGAAGRAAPGKRPAGKNRKRRRLT